MSGELPLKSAVTVSEMAKMVGLSRARFYQLQKAGIFPPPQLNPSTSRPFYDQVAQQVCLEVRKRNCGVNGQVVLFYARRQEITPTKARPKKLKPIRKEKSSLVEALQSLGLTTTNAEVEQAVNELFPGGTAGKDESELVTAIFLHLKRRNRGDSVGR